MGNDKKLKLNDLKIKSFVTTDERKEIKGGFTQRTNCTDSYYGPSVCTATLSIGPGYPVCE